MHNHLLEPSDILQKLHFYAVTLARFPTSGLYILVGKSFRFVDIDIERKNVSLSADIRV